MLETQARLPVSGDRQTSAHRNRTAIRTGSVDISFAPDWIDREQSVRVRLDPRRTGAVAVLATGLTVGSAVTAGAQTLLVEDFGSRWPEAPLAMQGPAAAQEVPPAIEKGAVAPPGARPPASGPVVAGTWSGTVTQVGRSSKYTVGGGETDYSEQRRGVEGLDGTPVVSSTPISRERVGPDPGRDCGGGGASSKPWPPAS